MAIKFYRVINRETKQPEKYGCFSNFSSHSFILKDKIWQTSEHYFQAQKFSGTIYEDIVMRQPSPKLAADQGRNRSYPLRKDWEEVKDDIMYEALIAKFTQHPDIKDILLSTGEEEIIEDSPIDYYWGCGYDGSGKNMLGKLLMKARDYFRKNSENNK